VDVEARWPLAEQLVLSDPQAGLRGQLLTAYADPRRSYHDLRHLDDVLDRLDELQAHGVDFDVTAVRLAAWFHDAVYDGQPDAEERSAKWAEEALPAAGLPPGCVSEVARLVRLTERHDPRPDDRNGAALCDADLAILAASPPRYRAYVDAVRREYASVPDAAFRVGRAAVLAGLLGKQRLFTTEHAVTAWEAAARRNVTAELEELERWTG
jgi:predicted metal-dependent HD superfamily phosphohydrolase